VVTTSVPSAGTREALDDFELAAAISKKDEAAARLLFELHFDGLYRFLRHLTRHAEEAEDLAQQTLIRVLRSADRFDGRASLRSWIYSFALREYGRWRRRRLWAPLLCDVPAKHDVAEHAANAALLLDAISKLTPAHRATFLLHYVEGLSLEEISAAQDVPLGTIKSRLHFARTHLKSLLEQEEFYTVEPCRS
jgi:RNA polymerase sigma-70 factor (ECF subfamily)